MKTFLFTTTMLASIALTGIAQADSLADKLRAKQQIFKAEMHVACGKLDKSNCAQVLPRIAEHSVPKGLSISPDDSEGSVMSANGVCAGATDAAIGQRDAFAIVGKSTDCVGKYDTIGSPLYGYYGFLVVRADAPYNSLSGMVSSVPEGKHLTIAAGKDGSGGQTTLGILLSRMPSVKRVVDTSYYGEDTAPQRILDGSLTGFFFMDAPGSDAIAKLQANVDKNGKPLFKFLDIRANSDFYALTDWNGKKLYQEVTIASGLFHDTRTISVDAVVIASNAWREGPTGPKASNILAKAIDDAQASILGDTKMPHDWKPASEQ